MPVGLTSIISRMDSQWMTKDTLLLSSSDDSPQRSESLVGFDKLKLEKLNWKKFHSIAEFII